jgi:exodeoxyribonuclease VII large subunit
VTTYLNVPYPEKAEAKARGARWDSEARKWFVPVGRDLEPFLGWIVAETPGALIDAEAGESRGIPLSQLLAGVATAVAQAYRQGVWTTAEVVNVDGDPHVYLELAERDAGGNLIAKAKGIVWRTDVARVLGQFHAATGVRLAAGIKVLIRARPELSARYGLTLHIDAIDPSYTLGDLEARKREIRERLTKEGIFDRNRLLPAPWDYRYLLVVSPPRAAGLGDFAREADRLQRHGLCETVYTHSRFEGEGAATSIREAIEQALAAWSGSTLPDAIVIIRGGGAVNDLAWLNDYELVRFVCLSPVPVLTGIGHERDSTLLDEVAHQTFDTPSKVVAGIQALIVKRARESQGAFDEIAGLASRQLMTTRADVDTLDGGIKRQVLETVATARAGLQAGLTNVQRHAQRVLHDAAQEALHALSDVRAGAGSQLAAARARASSLFTQVEAAAATSVRDARRQIADARQDVVNRAHLEAVAHRKQSQDLFEEIKRGARNTLRLGADAAEATFREVLAQGPEKTLGRGFAVVHSKAGKIVTSTTAAGRAGEIRVQFKDGTIEATVRRGKEDASEQRKEF